MIYMVLWGKKFLDLAALRRFALLRPVTLSRRGFQMYAVTTPVCAETATFDLKFDHHR